MLRIEFDCFLHFLIKYLLRKYAIFYLSVALNQV